MRLTLTHFGAVDSISVDILPGLNAVLGRNGAGKSTLVNAFYLALVGDPIDGSTCKELITWGFSEALVQLETASFTITRKLTFTGVKHKMVIGDEVITKKTEIADKIISIFNLPSIETFKNVYFAEQYRAIDFIYGTNSARLDTLSNVFGLKKFEIIRSRLHDVAASIAVEGVSDELLQQLGQAVDAAMQRLSEFDAEAYIAKCDVLDDDTYLELCNHATKCATKDEFKELVASIDATKQLLQDIQNELDALPKGPTQEQREAYAKAYRYQQLLPDFTAAEKCYKDTICEKHPSEESIIKMCADIDTHLGTLSAKRASMLERRNLLVSGKCPITGGAPCHDLLALSDPKAIDAEIAKIDAEIEQASSDKECALQLHTEARIYSKKVADVTARYENLKGLITQVENYKDFDFDSWNAANADIDAVEHKRADLMKQLASVNVTLDSLNKQHDEYKQYPLLGRIEMRQEALDKLKLHDEAVVACKTYESMRPTLTDTVNTTVNQYNTALKSIEDSKKLIAVREHFELLRDLLHRDNVPRLLLEGVRGDLNSKLSEYVNMFDLPYELDWTADGDLLYKPLNAEWCSTRMLSGGQKYILMLSLRCSFAELLDSVFPVLVLDEPTTGLDTVNRGLLAETLLSISDTLCTRGMSLLIPTHDETIIQNAQNIIKIGE